jgi:hypothetical protein
MSELMVLRTYSYRHEAEVVRSVLEGHGIHAEVMSDDCGAFDPALGLVRGAHLMVSQGDADRADALVRQGLADPACAVAWAAWTQWP